MSQFQIKLFHFLFNYFDSALPFPSPTIIINFLYESKKISTYPSKNKCKFLPNFWDFLKNDDDFSFLLQSHDILCIHNPWVYLKKIIKKKTLTQYSISSIKICKTWDMVKIFRKFPNLHHKINYKNMMNSQNFLYL